MRLLAGLVMLLSLLALASGCGRSDGLDLAPVAGTVTVEGTPVPGAGVSLRPDASKGNKTLQYPSGTADTQGKYELITAGRKGAEPGWYKVVVFPPPPPTVGAELKPLTDWPFAKKYADPETTDLSVEVKHRAPAGAYDFKLSR